MIVLLAVLGLAVGLYAWGQNQPSVDWRLDSVSPDGSYSVVVRGKQTPPSQPYYHHGDHSVRFTVLKNSQPIVLDEPLYAGDEYDDLFLDLYPRRTWLSNSILRFSHPNKTIENQFDEIEVSNNDSHNFSYFRINFGPDMYLLLDLGARTKIVFHASPQTDKDRDRSGMAYWGQTMGKTIQGGAAFDIRGKYKGPSHYYFDIDEKGVSITSKEFEIAH
jgi:hypothetical protein